MLFYINVERVNEGVTDTLGAREFDSDDVMHLTTADRVEGIIEMLRIMSAYLLNEDELTTTIDRSMDFSVEIDYDYMQLVFRNSLETYIVALIPSEEVESDDEEGDEDDDENTTDENALESLARKIAAKRKGGGKQETAPSAAGRCGSCGHNAYNHETSEEFCGVCDDACVFQAEGLAGSLK